MLSSLARTKYQEALHDHCGVFGMWGPGEDVAKITYFALFSLQHRGQEGAGIMVANGRRIKGIRRMGMVNNVFTERNLSRLKGHIAIGHVRYSTTGGNTQQNVQPITVTAGGETLSLAHNGNIVNAAVLARLLPAGSRQSTSDTEVMALSVMQAPGATWRAKIRAACKTFSGAYSVVAATPDRLLAFRDPWGFRPLALGQLNGGYVVASETCAFDMTGARYIRDIAPGEIVAIDKHGVRSLGKITKPLSAFCLFEYVYLARPDSILNGKLVHAVRRRSGEILAREAPVSADLVVAIPDSGTSAAVGYSEASGIPFGEILIKNRYVGRTFISPEQHLREQGVKMKFNPMPQNVRGKRIVIVDDSIVRGTTMHQIVAVLRRCGAKEIHLRICSPPVAHPCFFGVDTANRRNLIASRMRVGEIKAFIGADSLHYLSLAHLIEATGLPKSQFCAACFTGNYPIPVPEEGNKHSLEAGC